MISCLLPLKILSRSFQLYCISQFHCLIKPFWRTVSLFPFLPFLSSPESTARLFASITPLRLSPSKVLFISVWTSTWPSSLLIPSAPLTWLGSCMGHSWLLLSSWNVSIQLWGHPNFLLGHSCSLFFADWFFSFTQPSTIRMPQGSHLLSLFSPYVLSYRSFHSVALNISMCPRFIRLPILFNSYI